MKVCMDCSRDKSRRTKANTGKRTKTRPRAVSNASGGERISLQAAIGHVVFDHVKVSTAARWAGKAKKTVADGAWEYVKRVVKHRDKSKCVLCGRVKNELDVHHRKPKQMGGSDALTTYGLANLVSLCRNHHSWVHAHPADAMELGLLLSQSADPEQEPVLVHGMQLVLTNLGVVGKEVPGYEAQDSSGDSAGETSRR